MNQLFQDSVFFGVLISLAAYGIGMLLKLKTGWSLMNPLLISIILVIITLLLYGENGTYCFDSIKDLLPFCFVDSNMKE
jgi:putative effector of murein hydrolase